MNNLWESGMDSRKAELAVRTCSYAEEWRGRLRQDTGGHPSVWKDPPSLEAAALRYLAGGAKPEALVDAYENTDYFQRLQADFKDQSGVKELRTTFESPPHWWQIFHPAHRFSRFLSVTGMGYRPYGYNNIPYHLGTFTRDGDPRASVQMIRMGMPLYGQKNIEPVFKAYLRAKKEHDDKRKPQVNEGGRHYTHLYINNLKRSIENPYTWYNPLRYLLALYNFFKNFERNREHARSEAIHALEKEEELGVAVVSLPADCEWFLRGYDKHKGTFKKGPIDTMSTRDLFNQILSSIENNVNDFYLSKELRAALGWSHDGVMALNCEREFKASLMTVLNYNNFDIPLELNSEQRQALLFDFTKYRFPKLLAERLGVSSMNMTCKDGIDRGGIGTTWFMVQEALDQNAGITQEAFMAHLYGPALLVKERVTNEHRHILWHALLTQYSHYPKRFEDANMGWMVQWLENNKPEAYSADALKENLPKQEEQEDVHAQSVQTPGHGMHFKDRENHFIGPVSLFPEKSKEIGGTSPSPSPCFKDTH
jgi:hypothetical protein